MNIEAGQVIDGKYRVVKLLGKGGMGAVYLAEHMVIGKRVALKVLLGSVAENETAVARFEREAQAAARIGNDHIMEIFDFGSLSDGSRFMVCEYLEGETLAARVAREVRMSPASLLPLARQLLGGLGAAHRAGVVHRDLKPENVFILKQKAGWADFVKIIDFGISKFQPLSAEGGMQMTATGIVVGTPCYLSPEQARGSREADARSDLYAVGVILYECITGDLPFNAPNVNDLLFKIVLENPRPIRELAPDVDPAFADLITTAMARDPDHRFQSADAFIQALDRWGVEHGLPAGPVTGDARRHPSGDMVQATSADVRLPSASTRSPTPGTWADSNVSVAAFQPRPRSKLPLAVAGSLIGVLLVAGVSFALLGGGDGAKAAGGAASSGASAAVSSLPPTSSPAEPETPPVEPLAATPPSPTLAAPAADPNSLEPPPLPGTPAVRAIAPARRSAPAAGNKKPPAAAAAATPAPAAAPAAPAAAANNKHKRDFGY